MGSLEVEKPSQVFPQVRPLGCVPKTTSQDSKSWTISTLQPLQKNCVFETAARVPLANYTSGNSILQHVGLPDAHHAGAA